MSGEARLTSNGQATVRVVLVAALVGGALFSAWAAAMSNRFRLGWFDTSSGGSPQGPWITFAFLGAFIGVVSTLLVVHLRQPKGAKLTWDSWGVTEWDGDGVRTAIPFATMRTRMILTAMARRNLNTAVAGAVLSQGSLPGSSDGATIGGQLILSDAEGRRIDVTQGVQNATLNDRLNTVSNLGELVDAIGQRPGSDAPQTPRSENLAVLGFVLGIAGYIAAFLILLVLTTQSDEPLVPLATMAASLLLLLRSLPWWVRARRLGRGPSTRVEIVDGTLSELTVSNAGTQTMYDVSKLRHPDARIGERRGAAWINVIGSSLLSIETEGARKARLNHRRSNLIAALGRTLIALLVLVPATPAIAELARERLGAADPNVQVLWTAEAEPVVTRKTSFQSFAVDPQTQLAMFETDGDMFLLDLKAPTSAKRLPTDRGCWPQAAAFSPGAKFALVACEHDDEAVLFSLESDPPKELGRAKKELGIEDVALSADRAVLAGFGAMDVLEVPSFKKTGEIQRDDTDTARRMMASPSTRAVALVSLYASSHKAFLWRGVEGEPAKRLTSIDPTDGEAMAFSSDGKLVAFAEYDAVQLVYVEKGEVVREIKVEGPTGLAFGVNDTVLAVTRGTDPRYATVQFFDTANGTLRGSVPLKWKTGLFGLESGAPSVLTFTPDGTLLFWGRYPGVALKIRPPL